MAPGDPCPRCGGPTAGVDLVWTEPPAKRLACVGIGSGRSCGWSGPTEASVVGRGANADPRLTAVVAARIRRRREAKEWTQWKLANEAGLDPSEICRIEAGKRLPGLPTLAVIAKALGCRTGELVP